MIDITPQRSALESSTKGELDSRHLSPATKLALAVGLVGCLISGDAAAHNEPPTPEQITTQQFSCKITDVQDTGKVVRRNFTRRGNVIISLALTNNPDVTNYTRSPSFKSDTTWYSPTAAIFSETSRQVGAAEKTPMPVGIGGLREQIESSNAGERLRFKTYPIETQPVGTQADIYIKTSAFTSNQDQDATERITGHTLCGTLERASQGWELTSTSPNAPKTFVAYEQ